MQMENSEHGRFVEYTWNKRPDGTIEEKTLYEDGYQSDDAPPGESNYFADNIIHVEKIYRADGTTESMMQDTDGNTETNVSDPVQEQSEQLQVPEQPQEYQPEEPEREQPQEPESEEPEPQHEEPEHDEPENDGGGNE